MQLIDSFLTLGETALLFSPLRAQLDALSDRLRQAQVPHAVLDGRTPPARRAAIVAAFKRSAPVPVTFTRISPDITTPSCTLAPSLPRLPILLCGECMTDGHSFPATRNIVLISPFLPWDKFKLSLDRIHRLNSEREIRVHVLITENTVEERHYARMLEKRKTCAMQGTTDISAFECRYPIPESDLNEYQAETAVWPILLRSLGRLGASWPA